MLYKKVALLSSIVLSSLSLNANAAISIDGDLSDWLNTPTGSSSDWTNLKQSNVSYAVDDQILNYLDPGYGGQTFDAEAMYLNFDSGTLNIAIVTGLPASGSGSFVPGDISFDLNGDKAYEYAMVVTQHEVWNTGLANDDAGYFIKAANESGLSDPGAWNYSPINGYDNSKQHPTQVNKGNGSVLSQNTLKYTKLTGDFANIGGLGDYTTEPHYLIETSVQFTNDGGYGSDFLAAISAGTLNVHWNPTCNNDYIIANMGAQGNGVPEPGSLALVALGLIGFGVKKRKA